MRRQRDAADGGDAVRQPRACRRSSGRAPCRGWTRARACRRNRASRRRPLPSISKSKSRGSRFCGSPGQPPCRTSVIMLPSITMSIGLSGGPPVPSSISVTPRITIFLNGPWPSPALRAGAGDVALTAAGLGRLGGAGRWTGLGARILARTGHEGSAAPRRRTTREYVFSSNASNGCRKCPFTVPPRPDRGRYRFDMPGPCRAGRSVSRRAADQPFT